MSIPESRADSETIQLPRFRSWGFLLSLGACFLAYPLIAFWDMPLLGAWLVTGVFGWLLIHCAGLNRGAVLLWCFSAVLLSTAFWDVLNGTPDASEMLRTIPLGLAVALTSAIVFFVAGVNGSTNRGRNWSGFALVFLMLIFLWVGVASINHHRFCQEEIQRTRQTLIDLHQLGNEVELLRVQFGRLPKNEEEFVRFRGKPMPPFYKKYCYHYYKNDEEHYELSCLVGEYIWHFYGPASAQRFRAEFF